MKPKDKNKFIAKTAALFIAGSYATPEAYPIKPKQAVEEALELWAELEKQNLISADD